MSSTSKQKKGCNIFSFIYGRERPADKPLDEIDSSRGVKNYFKLLGYNFGRIFTINIYAILGNFPIFFIMLALSTNLHEHTKEPASVLFAPLYSALELGAVSPKSQALFGTLGAQTSVSVWTPAAWCVLIIGAVLLLGTFGPVSAGITYNMRNIVKHEPIFMWSDFWYAIKRNLRQSIIIGILDMIVMVLFAYNIYFYYLNLGRYLFNVFFWFTIVLLVMYLFMRHYIYLLLVTFELSIIKIYKNALIFSILGFGRNLVAFLISAVLIAFNFSLMMVYLPIGIILPFIITVGLCLYTSVYTAWPKIEKIMIEPYNKPSEQ